MTQSSTDEALGRARDAVKRQSWREAYDLYAPLSAAGGLPAADVEGMAEAALSLIQTAEHGAPLLERAHKLYLESGDPLGAARTALRLRTESLHRGAASVAAGWLNVAARLLADQAEAAEHGYLAYAQSRTQIELGNLEQGIVLAEKAFDIGCRFGDRDLQAYGLMAQGMAKLGLGYPEDGIALIDEAAASAVAGELRAFTSSVIYCNLISACRNVADFRRAGEWTEAARSWCGDHESADFPGVCRVYRAEIMRFRGAWAEAEQDIRAACDELERWDSASAADAFYELGEIRARMGDLESAEEAFRHAHGLGYDPQPGLAALRLRQGNVAAAAAMIKRALAGQTWDQLARARLLPDHVEIAVAAGDVDTARSAAGELEAVATTYPTEAMRAFSLSARGAVQLAEGETASAIKSLNSAIRLWKDVDAPYELARTRLLLAEACRLDGDCDSAEMELQAARSAFERLGARLDASRVAEMMDRQQAGAAAGARAAARSVRTFMFTDMCRSTNLVEAIGDEAWESLLAWHDQTLRSLFAENGGEEVKHEGDGFFVAFADGPAAVRCAAAIQRTLADHRRDHGFAPQVRIGLHAAEATRRGNDYIGKAVHEAARIAALATAGEIIASRETVADGIAGFPLSSPRAVPLKGIAAPVHVVTIDWR